MTTARLLTGLVGCGFYGLGGPPWLLAGSGLLILSMLLDRADGILARLTDQKSAFGHRYDLTSDVVTNVCIFIGLGIGLRGGDYGNLAMAMGVIAGLAVGAIFLCVMVIESASGSGTAALPAVAGFDADDFMFVVPIGVAFGGGEWLLVAASIGAPLFAVGFVWWFRQTLFGRG